MDEAAIEVVESHQLAAAGAAEQEPAGLELEGRPAFVRTLGSRQLDDSLDQRPLQLADRRQQPVHGAGVGQLVEYETAGSLVQRRQRRERRCPAQLAGQTDRVGAMSHREVAIRDEPLDRRAGRTVGGDRHQVVTGAHHRQQIVADAPPRWRRQRCRTHDGVDACLRRHLRRGNPVAQLAGRDQPEREPVLAGHHDRIAPDRGHLLSG